MPTLEERVEALEQQVARLIAAAGTRSTSSTAGSAGGRLAGVAWTTPYEVAVLEAPESWIEMHETSARPHLHRMITTVVTTEGPVVEHLVLRRVREMWGIKRAGTRIQQVFDQAIRQLYTGGKLMRSSGTLTMPGQELLSVRIPGADDVTRRSVDEIPSAELDFAIVKASAELGATPVEELTREVAKLFGWTRRGAEIQSLLDAAVARTTDAGLIRRSGDMVSPAE